MNIANHSMYLDFDFSNFREDKHTKDQAYSSLYTLQLEAIQGQSSEARSNARYFLYSSETSQKSSPSNTIGSDSWDCQQTHVWTPRIKETIISNSSYQSITWNTWNLHSTYPDHSATAIINRTGNSKDVKTLHPKISIQDALYCIPNFTPQFIPTEENTPSVFSPSPR